MEDDRPHIAYDHTHTEEQQQQPRPFSCWGHLRLSSLWQRLKRFQNQRRRRHNLLRSGGLNYDPLSYAQNFDDAGAYDDSEDASMLQQNLNFSTRFVQVRQPAAVARPSGTARV